MEDVVIRPSMKMVWAAYALAILVTIAAMWAIYTYAPDGPQWLYAIPLVVLLWPLGMHMKRRLVTLHLQGDHLTLETGFLSRTRRTLDMAKIQDVTVKQTLGQRILGVGDISLESAGERSIMGIRNLDRPRVIADAILNTSRQGRTLF